jgi:hypothetical protein
VSDTTVVDDEDVFAIYRLVHFLVLFFQAKRFRNKIEGLERIHGVTKFGIARDILAVSVQTTASTPF